MKHLDLFAGVGGFTIAAHQLGIETTQLVEIDSSAQKVLKRPFPHIPIHNDVRTYFPRHREHDLITAGFPCTSTSAAGRREGINGRESNLWWEAWRIINVVRPRFVVVENPVGLLHRGLSTVIHSLAAIGYVGEWFCVRASDLGAGHRRDRLFVVSYPDRRRQGQDRECSRRSQMRSLVQEQRACAKWLSTVSRSDGDHDGLSSQLVFSFDGKLPSFPTVVPSGKRSRNRIRILAGRTVTPAQAAIALSRVLQIEKEFNDANYYKHKTTSLDI